MTTPAGIGFPAFPRHREAGAARSWWGNAWCGAMEDTTPRPRAAPGPPVRRQRPRRADHGQSPGRIAAPSSTSDDGAFTHTVCSSSVLDDAEWGRFLDQVAAKAGHLAALLDGDMPRTLVESAAAADVHLLPDDRRPASRTATAPASATPCQHAAALCYQTAWLLDDDPFVLLLLRGRDRAALVGDLTPRAAPPDGEPAAEVFARPERPLPLPGPVPARTVPTPVPPPPGLPVDLVPGLVATAAARARALLA